MLQKFILFEEKTSINVNHCLFLFKVFIKSELKVGVIYVKEGQYSEEEILSNNRESEHFTEFLSILGEKVRLKGTLSCLSVIEGYSDVLQLSF